MWCFFLFPQALPLGAWGFLLSLNHDWFACQLQIAEFLWKGSHEGPLFHMFPLSLQSIISNQLRPRRLRGAWFSHLLRTGQEMEWVYSKPWNPHMRQSCKFYHLHLFAGLFCVEHKSTTQRHCYLIFRSKVRTLFGWCGYFYLLCMQYFFVHPSISAASSDYWWWSGVKEGTLTQLL